MDIEQPEQPPQAMVQAVKPDDEVTRNTPPMTLADTMTTSHFDDEVAIKASCMCYIALAMSVLVGPCVFTGRRSISCFSER
jgi:hypothetical protein